MVSLKAPTGDVNVTRGTSGNTGPFNDKTLRMKSFTRKKTPSFRSHFSRFQSCNRSELVNERDDCHKIMDLKFNGFVCSLSAFQHTKETFMVPCNKHKLAGGDKAF